MAWLFCFFFRFLIAFFFPKCLTYFEAMSGFVSCFVRQTCRICAFRFLEMSVQNILTCFNDILLSSHVHGSGASGINYSWKCIESRG
uniref:Putative secreted protein n=1 Tax=Ixodes ricinus TaxID=34613 RepID=A0A147BJG2_IXORI